MAMTIEAKSVVKARKIERMLAQKQLSYKTYIVKTRKRGLRYEIMVVEEHGA